MASITGFWLAMAAVVSSNVACGESSYTGEYPSEITYFCAITCASDLV